MSAAIAQSPARERVDAAVADVIAMGRDASARGWTPATSGNFSARIDAEHAAVTRSGVDKGTLTPDDVLIQPLAAALAPGSSAEAMLHVRLYRDHPEIGAVYHAHAPVATVIGRLEEAEGRLILEGWELQKALAGVVTHACAVETLIFANDQDVSALAERAAKAFASPPPLERLRAPGYLIAGHGLYAWGADRRAAMRHFEALETLFHLELMRRSHQP